MNKKKQLNITLLVAATLLSAHCNADKLEIKPFFNPDNQSAAFFKKSVAFNSASDFLTVQEKSWEYETDLKHEKAGNKKATNCKTLKKLLKEGYTAAKDYEYGFVNAQSLTCSMWKEMATFKPYSVSYMNDLSLNKDFATKAPARFALLISNEEIKKAESAKSWDSMSQIKKIDLVNDMRAIYYDSTGGIQRLTLMAKGDYNGDGIEDRLLFMENSVE
ncbi:hypothetical protein MNBD_GAMMA10-1716, partial [hydrothermal vent metagenome]